MALPRKILNALRAGQYVPSNASRKAREAANRLQAQRNEQSRPAPMQRDTFRSVKTRMKQRKHEIYYGTQFYDPRASARAVENSDEVSTMSDSLGLSDAQMTYLASMASKARAAQHKTGDAGELEIYLKYDFLFYHLQVQA